MQPLLIFLLVAFPMMLMAQTVQQSQSTHQHAEALFMAKNPSAQKIDVEKLTAEQKDDHQTCNTCGSKKTSTSVSSQNSSSPSLTKELLEKEQERLMSLLQPLLENKNDMALAKKYQTALVANQKQLAELETNVSNDNWEEKNQQTERNKSK